MCDGTGQHGLGVDPAEEHYCLWQIEPRQLQEVNCLRVPGSRCRSRVNVLPTQWTKIKSEPNDFCCNVNTTDEKVGEHEEEKSVSIYI